MKAVPAGWTAAPGNTSRVFTYHHVVVDAAAEPASYAWQLSGPSKWGAIMTGFSGVDPRTPVAAALWAWVIWPRA
jgi:hypothetical protein